jgi:hypothetical protein
MLGAKGHTNETGRSDLSLAGEGKDARERNPCGAGGCHLTERRRMPFLEPSHTRGGELSREEALGEGGDEGDLDQQADDGFGGGELRNGILQRNAAREEAAPME